MAVVVEASIIEMMITFHIILMVLERITIPPASRGCIAKYVNIVINQDPIFGAEHMVAEEHLARHLIGISGVKDGFL